MFPEVRANFSEVEQLLRILFVRPASSCTAERSFSAQRLKNWLHKNMTQGRLNVVPVCNIHKELVDDVDLHKLDAFFAGRSEIRRNIFANWK